MAIRKYGAYSKNVSACISKFSHEYVFSFGISISTTVTYLSLKTLLNKQEDYVLTIQMCRVRVDTSISSLLPDAHRH